MSIGDIAGAWLQQEARRRPQFKQQTQDLEHGQGYGSNGVEGAKPGCAARLSK